MSFLKIPKDKALEVVQEHGVTRVEEVLQWANDQLTQGKDIENMAGLVIDALKKGYTLAATVTCTNCNGKCNLPIEGAMRPCPKCNGTGRQSPLKNLQRLPPEQRPLTAIGENAKLKKKPAKSAWDN